MYGGIFNDRFIGNLLLSLLVKEFGKSVNIWRSYRQQYIVFVFLTHGVVTT